MKPPLRLVFDDCLSKNAVAAMKQLAGFSRGTVELAHLVDFDLGGQLDDVWVPQIAADKWIVVTTDRGKKKSRGGKLPLLCQAAGLSYVMISGGLHQRNTFDKIRAIMSVWPQLVDIVPGDSCQGFLLYMHSGAKESFGLKCVWPDADAGISTVQRTLTFDPSVADTSVTQVPKQEGQSN